MAIFNFYLDLDKEYIQLIKDIYKVLVILIVFQIILYFSNSEKNIINSALTGNILNDQFITLLIYIIISISSYYLIFDRLISINY
jgi:hypothetical protein